MRSSNPEPAVDELARLTFVFRIFAVLLCLISLADAAQRVPGVFVALLAAAFLSFTPVRWWDRVAGPLRAHPAIFAVDVATCGLLLALAGPVSPFFVYTLATAMLAGILYGHFGAVYFAVMLVVGYELSVDAWDPDSSFMVVVGLPSLYPVFGSGAAHIAAGYRWRAEDAVRLADAAAAEAASHERARLARELHDSIAKTVMGLSLQAHALRTRLAAVESPLLPLADGLRAAAEQASRESREALVTLREGILTAPFPEVIADVITEIEEAAGVVIETRNLHEAEIDRPMVRFEVVRIVAEALRNAAAHAGSPVVRVEAVRHDDSVAIVVRDEGRGFDPDTRPRAAVAEGHFGLAGIFERAQAFGGTVEVHSSPGRGTTVAVRVPRHPAAAGPGLASAPPPPGHAVPA